MGVDHRGLDVIVAEQFLDRSDVIPVLKHVRGKRVAERVTTGVLGDPRLADGVLDGALDGRLVDVMASLFAGLLIYPPVFGREHVLPAPVSRGIRVLAGQGIRQVHAPPSLLQIALVNRADMLQMLLERPFDGLGQQGDSSITARTSSLVITTGSRRGLRARINPSRVPISRPSTCR